MEGYPGCSIAGFSILVYSTLGFDNGILLNVKESNIPMPPASRYLTPIILFILFSIAKSCYNSKTGRKIQRSDHENIVSLRIGIIGMIICTIVEYGAILKMYTDYWTAYPYFYSAFIFFQIFFGFFVLEQSEYCKFPLEPEKPRSYLMMFSLLIGVYRALRMGTMIEVYHTIFLASIIWLSVDLYILFSNPSAVVFLMKHVGKDIEYTKSYGATVRGHFDSVDIGLKLSLSNVREYRDGKFFQFRKHETVTDFTSFKVIDKVDDMEVNSISFTDGSGPVCYDCGGSRKPKSIRKQILYRPRAVKYRTVRTKIN